MTPEVDPLLAQHKQRNRINQRNHRARRQEYVHELEQRVREYERRERERFVALHARQGGVIGGRVSSALESESESPSGVVALLVEENRKLRALLDERFGVGREEVGMYLAGGGGGDGGGSVESSSTFSLAFDGTRSPLQHVGNDLPFANGSSSQALPIDPRGGGNLSRTTRTASKLVEADPSSSENKSTFPKQSQPGPRPEERNCEEAAMIIQNVRGAGSVGSTCRDDDVWAELGCEMRPGSGRGEWTCTVKNSHVFELLDKS